jgi:hypothetical protein
MRIPLEEASSLARSYTSKTNVTGRPDPTNEGSGSGLEGGGYFRMIVSVFQRTCDRITKTPSRLGEPDTPPNASDQTRLDRC